jgi:hypothetical protein
VRFIGGNITDLLKNGVTTAVEKNNEQNKLLIVLKYGCALKVHNTTGDGKISNVL